MAERLIGAIEAGGTKFVLALARENGERLAETRIPTETPATCFPAMAEWFRTAEAAHGKIAAFGRFNMDLRVARYIKSVVTVEIERIAAR